MCLFERKKICFMYLTICLSTFLLLIHNSKHNSEHTNQQKEKIKQTAMLTCNKGQLAWILLLKTFLFSYKSKNQSFISLISYSSSSLSFFFVFAPRIKNQSLNLSQKLTRVSTFSVLWCKFSVPYPVFCSFSFFHRSFERNISIARYIDLWSVQKPGFRNRSLCLHSHRNEKWYCFFFIVIFNIGFLFLGKVDIRRWDREKNLKVATMADLTKSECSKITQKRCILYSVSTYFVLPVSTCSVLSVSTCSALFFFLIWMRFRV